MGDEDKTPPCLPPPPGDWLKFDRTPTGLFECVAVRIERKRSRGDDYLWLFSLISSLLLHALAVLAVWKSRHG